MSPAADKPLKICLRGLPANTELRAIQKDLRDRGLDPIFMRHVDAKGKGAGIFCVQLQINPDIAKVFDIKKMLGASVKVETWRGKQGPPQCQRCQGFRHSAAECLREYRCVHCARPHPSKQCNRPNDIPTCANCRGPHTANDLSCPAMRREEIAKAGIVLRNSGYLLATPKPVDEANAPSSLMAEANGKWSDSKRRRRKKKVQDKSERTPTPELKESQKTEQPLVAFGNQKKSQPPQDTSREQRLDGSIIKETSQAIIKNQPVSQEVPQALVEEEVQLVSQKYQQAIVDPTKEKNQLIAEFQTPTNPISNEAKMETTTTPGAVRAKVVYECVLILQSVLSAIQQGHNPVPIILESLAELYKDAQSNIVRF